MTKYTEGRNRKHVLMRFYDSGDVTSIHQLNQDIIELTKLSARLSIVVGNHRTVVNVYCRTDVSKVYRTAIRLGFFET